MTQPDIFTELQYRPVRVLDQAEADATVSLTPRQQAAYEALVSAGAAGARPAAIGALMHDLKEGRWSHGRDDRCDYCARDGLAVLKALRKKGVARYRAKLKVWQADPLPVSAALPPGMTTEIPF